MRPAKKLAATLRLEAEEQQEEAYRQMAEAERAAAERRGRPVLVIPISTFSTEGRLIKSLQPFALYAEPMNGGVLVTAGITRAAGFGPNVNEAIAKFLAGIEHRFLFLRSNTGNMEPPLEDELRRLSCFVALQ